MASKGRPNGLTQEEKSYICQGVAQFLSWDEIAEGFLQRFPERYKYAEDPVGRVKERINYYSNDPHAAKHQATIQEMRKHWRERIQEIPLANVRKRIECLACDVERIEKRLSTAGELPEERKAQRIYVDVFVDLIKEKAALLDQIAQEAGQKVARNQNETDLNLRGSTVIPVELHMPDFRQEETDGAGT